MIGENNPDKFAELERKVKLWFSAVDRFSNFFAEIEEGFKFVLGDQFSDEKLKLWRDVYKRPTDVYNLMLGPFNTILGDFYQNHQKDLIFPEVNALPEIAEKLTDVISHYKYKGEYDYHFSRTLYESLIKIGYIQAYWGNNNDLTGGLEWSNIPNEDVVFDVEGRHRFLDDGRFIARQKWIEPKFIKLYWRDKWDLISDALKYRASGDYLSGNDNETYHKMMTSQNTVDERNGLFRIVEFHEMKSEESIIAVNLVNQDTKVITSKKMQRLYERNKNFRITEGVKKVKYISNFIPGLNITLDEKKAELQDQRFDIVMLSAYNYGRFRMDSIGIVKNMKGPQESFNNWVNRTQDVLNKQLNTGLITKRGYWEQPELLERYGAEPGIKLYAKEDAPAEISRLIHKMDPPKYPFAEDKMANNAYEFLYKIIGLTPNQMGFAETKQENASLYQQRVQQAKIALVTINMNIRYAKQRVNQKAVDIIQMDLPENKYFILTNRENLTQQEFIANQRVGNQILNDFSVGKYMVLPDMEDRDPIHQQIKAMQKMELTLAVDRLLQSPAAQVYDFRWLLEDVNLGNIDVFIKNIENYLQGKIDQEALASAFGINQNILNLAEQKQNFDNAGFPSEKAAPNNKSGFPKKGPQR